MRRRPEVPFFSASMINVHMARPGVGALLYNKCNMIVILWHSRAVYIYIVVGRGNQKENHVLAIVIILRSTNIEDSDYRLTRCIAPHLPPMHVHQKVNSDRHSERRR